MSFIANAYAMYLSGRTERAARAGEVEILKKNAGEGLREDEDAEDEADDERDDADARGQSSMVKRW